MDAARLENLAADFTSQSPLNHVCIELSGEELTLFDRPLLGYACAGDPCLKAFLAPGVIGPHYRPPQAWLETAQTVVSFFLPFSQAVRAQNRSRSIPAQSGLALWPGGGPALCGGAEPSSAPGAAGSGL